MNDFLSWFLDAVRNLDPVLRILLAGVGILFETSILIGLIVFGWVRHRLLSDVDNAVLQVSDTTRRVMTERGDAAGSEADVRVILINANLGGSADVFVLLLSPDGSIAANPSDVPTSGLPAGCTMLRA